MIESDRTFGTFTIFCDMTGCSYDELFDTDGNWSAMIAEAKENGWKMQKQDDEWFHKCPSHQ